MANDFLFELGVEELPSGLVYPLAEAFKASVIAALEKAQLSYENAKAFATPRRLAILLSGLNEEQPSQHLSRRGPALNAAYGKDGQPTPALLGFAKSCGVTVSDLKTQKTDKGEWLVHESMVSGVKTTELLPSIISQALSTLPIKKPMRWGEGEIEFARPVHWVVMLWGSAVLPCEILGTAAGRHTYGHRFLAGSAFELAKPSDYEPLLQEAYVIADFFKRKALIVEQITKVATDNNAEAIMPDALLNEVTSIVEWPEALVASFEQKFLEVPQEALIASMQEHQKCFPLQDKEGKLLAQFITVSNLKSKKPLQVIAGNEKVMRARLSDAAFFFSQDKKTPLSAHIPATANVIFQARLGSLFEKTSRIQTLMIYLATLFSLNKEQAIRAAQLSKCDLLTGMVGEFPELQGTMGYYYALHDGEPETIAKALEEQYLPRYAGDDLPGSLLGMSLSLAERMDTLVGIFGINQKPSGDKDPFKLRRHALAIVRMLVSQPLPIRLSSLINESLSAYGSVIEKNTEVRELQAFILERLQSYYQGKDLDYDIIQAALARQSDWLYDLDKRIRALVDFVKLDEAKSLAAACKRVGNILQQSGHQSDQVDDGLLQETAERSLYQHMLEIEKSLVPLYQQGDYVAVLTQLAGLRLPVDTFFEQVMVMVEDKQIKANRLSLLSGLQKLLQGTADISLLQIA